MVIENVLCVSSPFHRDVCMSIQRHIGLVIAVANHIIIHYKDKKQMVVVHDLISVDVETCYTVSDRIFTFYKSC